MLNTEYIREYRVHCFLGSLEEDVYLDNMSTELRSIDLEWDMRILNYATLIASFGSGGGRHRFTVCGTSVSRCHQRNRTCTFGA